MKKIIIITFLALILFVFTYTHVQTQDTTSQVMQELDRTVLPIPEPTYPPITELDVRDATPPPRFEVKAPKDAPNIVIILIDDLGFGQSSTFGGPIRMPTLDKLADGGLWYNEFHTTALCSPTRVALQTGRNSHSANAGSIMETGTAFPGQTGIRPLSMTPVAEILRLNGFSTAAFGKYHETPPWELTVSGPFDRWPTGSGFDKFYGFLGGETNHWFPLLYDGTHKVEPSKDPDYYFTTDLTDQAITWVKAQHSFTPDKPFFIYYASGATHAPHHVPKEWADKYKGEFDKGWDKVREETFNRQKATGIIPENTLLTQKPDFIKDWDKLSADEKRLFARQMEVFAGFASMTDYEIGRLIDAIEDIGELNNTLVFYIAGDNGASAEGRAHGLLNELVYFNGLDEPIESQLENIDKLGSPESYNHYAAGWAVTGDTPFKWTKQVASNYGGTRNGFVVHWPKEIKAKDELRGQWHHVVDIAPTILEATGIPEPKEVNGIPQSPMEGVSMLYSFNDQAAKDRHIIQYFEMFGNRAIYHDGWLASGFHRAPWDFKAKNALINDTWELYNTRNDFSLALDLSKENPQKLKEMQDLFLKEAVKYDVLPLDDRVNERFVAELVGRPDLIGKRTSMTLYGGMVGVQENTFINTKNKDYSITAEIETDGNANGVIISQGGRFAGWSFYMKDGKLMFAYNFLGMEQYEIVSQEAVPAGHATVVFNFVYDGGGMGKGGTVILSANGKQLAQGRIEKTVPITYGIDEGVSIGSDEETPVTDAYTIETSKFIGTLGKIVVDIGEAKLSEEDVELVTDLTLQYAIDPCLSS